MSQVYFERLDEERFRATEHTSGAWDVSEQHIAPALGLLAHVVELDLDRRGRDHLRLARLSFDILGTVPVAEVSTSVEVLRPGRTIELVEARLGHGDRDVVRLRAWLMEGRDTTAVAATPVPDLPPPGEVPAWDAREVWPGGFIESVEVRRDQEEPGRARFWVRTPLPVVDEPVSATARFLGLVDIANGITVRADPREVAFPNVDLTAHLHTEPRGEWVGFDTRVSFGATGLGVTSTLLYDQHGSVGTMAQMLTVRPA